ncbi:hypothetical protein LBMAG42_55410 [Deltaproteobacteria bacterium]|nr:hypothetical protein LBMAG42_55410 [Deltaproteobacteria bacterium]
MRLSSSTFNSDPTRALPGWLALAVVLLTLGAAEASVRAGYTPPGELAGKIGEARATLSPTTPDVLVFGTCIGAQTLDHGLFERTLGSTGSVHRLTAPGAFPMDWYLTLRQLLDPALVDMVIVVFTPGDLYQPTATWQSQTYDMMDSYSMQEVAYWACMDAACKAELYLRKSSLLYRNRAYLGNHVWTALGARRDASALAATTQAYAPRNAAREDAPWHFVKRMVALAKERETPILFVELPRNPTMSGDVAAATLQSAQVHARLAKLNVEVLRPRAPEGGYLDDVHFSPSGQRAITEAILSELRERGVVPK